MEELDQAAVDSAIILENRIRERIREELKYVLDSTVRQQVSEILRREKGSLDCCCCAFAIVLLEVVVIVVVFQRKS